MIKHLKNTETHSKATSRLPLKREFITVINIVLSLWRHFVDPGKCKDPQKFNCHRKPPPPLQFNKKHPFLVTFELQSPPEIFCPDINFVPLSFFFF